MRLNKSHISKVVSAILVAQATFFSSSAYVAAATEKSLIVGRYAPVESLDIANVWDVSVYTADQIFEPLYIVGKNGQPQPWLAVSATPDSDGTTWTFKLRPGVKFSDGSTLKAEDVVFSLTRHIKNAGGIPLLAPITSITAPDRDTVIIKLKGAYPALLSDISAVSNGIMPANFAGQTEAAFFQHPIGTGPFVLESWVPGGTVTLKKNSHYWQTNKPRYDELAFTVLPDENQRVQQLLAGQIDVIDNLPPVRFAELSKNPDISVTRSESWVIQILQFNTKNPQFSDVHVRRAVNLAIDRKALADATSFKTSDAASTIIPPTVAFYDPTTAAVDANIEAAKKELALSAYPHGFSTTILTPGGDQVRAQQAQIIQSQLGKIGIEVSIISLDPAVVREKTHAGDYALRLQESISDVSDPNIFLTYHFSPDDGGSDSYWTFYNNPHLTSVLRQASVEQDVKVRGALYHEAQEIVASDVPIIPLVYQSRLVATRSNLTGIEAIPNGATRFDSARDK
ncbi:glutathione ABC transporter substrate-binding protein [Pectobacterium araliae]|uniref:Glutathione ABC transporter substrate-binding protein n=1 Tax=Pectobacterium araliae TaxID=3073862 RepID=A0AAN0KAM0_9GAMM|nr:glutathione ABC transporter substrate-binding protein [Pectobacterium sp. MAFF 302110]GKW21613.1 glutathione ABC transporter substrate-binding protein [Pectobacterium carotovorum subsp. carotovorum]